MNMENVLSMFLRIVTEYDYLDFTEEELIADFEEIMSMAIVELQMQGLLLDIDGEEFEISGLFLSNDDEVKIINWMTNNA